MGCVNRSARAVVKTRANVRGRKISVEIRSRLFISITSLLKLNFPFYLN
jgi:hypothetical protein